MPFGKPSPKRKKVKVKMVESKVKILKMEVKKEEKKVVMPTMMATVEMLSDQERRMNEYGLNKTITNTDLISLYPEIYHQT